jgi:hypothetical protein
MATSEVTDLQRSILLRIKRSGALNDFIETKNPGSVEVLAVEAVVEAVTDLLQALAESILTQSLELLPLKSVNDTKCHKKGHRVF